MRSAYSVGIAKMDDPASAGRDVGLLDLLWRKVGCTYMSDLHVQPWRSVAISFAAQMDPERFTLWEWNDAAEYLLRECTKRADARSILALFQTAAGLGA